MIVVIDEMTCLFSVILNIVKDIQEGWITAEKMLW